MAVQIPLTRITSELFNLFDETFNQVQGIYLDKGTSLFETLATISAEEASHPVGVSCATIAAQVEHIRFYLDVLEGYMINQPPAKVDWGEIWRTVSEVTPEAWEASQAQLRASVERILAYMQQNETWAGEEDISAPLAILIHTAYHLGEIRQALCIVRA